jgi:predicted dehydrogenase
MKKLTASVVGGGAGGQLSLRALAASQNFELVALADTRVEVGKALEQEYSGLRTFTSHREMFDRCPTDVVCVSTYPPSHEDIVMDALQLPLKGILVEKPLGHTVASGRRIFEAVKARNLPMAVPHGLLALKTPLEIIERVQNGEIGDLKLVEIQNSGWDIINAGIHWLNFFVTLTGNEPLGSVMALCDASTRTYRDGMQVETAAVTYAQTRSGVRVVMHTGDFVQVNSGHGSTDVLFRIVGSAGQIEFHGWKNEYYLQNAAYPHGQKFVPEQFPITGHQRHLDYLVAQIEAGRPDYSIAQSSLMALEICEGAYLSSQHRSQVTFPTDEFQPHPVDWHPGQPYSGVGGGRDGRTLPK